MPGIDYRALRAHISMEHVLRLLRFRPTRRRGDSLRGPCPLHDPSGTGDSLCFSVHLGRHMFRCFRCGASGNQLDLWQMIHQGPLYLAALDLCQQAGIEPPLLPAPSATPHIQSRNPAPKPPRTATQ
jgi:DNA primase